MNSSLRKVVLLYQYYENNADTILDHLHAIQMYSSHDVKLVAVNRDDIHGLILSDYDCLIIHYSILASHDASLAPSLRTRIRSFRGSKAAFVQDEYRFIFRTIDVLHFLGVEVLFTLVAEDNVDRVYPVNLLPATQKITVLTGYVPEQLTDVPVPDWADRVVDVGYRARKLPGWYGRLARTKWQIGEEFKRHSLDFGLRVDISMKEEDRIYGQDWIRFLSNCRAVLGTESGASVCDFTGEIERNCTYFEMKHPDASFEDVAERFLVGVDGAITMPVISPRCFEAAALRTLMILYPGYYSGRLSAWRHYVPLNEDYSNIEEVVAVLRNPERAQEIIDRAYREVALAPQNSFRAMAKEVDRWLDRMNEAVADKGSEVIADKGSAVRTPPSQWASPTARVPAIRWMYQRLMPPAARQITRRLLWELRSLLRLARPVKYRWLYFAFRFRLEHLRTPLESARELAILLVGLAHCEQSGNATTSLLWNPKRGTLTIRKVLVDRLDVWEGCSISFEELTEVLTQRRVHTLAWESWDWGDALPRPLDRYHIFPALTGGGLPAPHRLARLIWLVAQPLGENVEAEK